MTFLVDAQLPPALALWLGQQGHAAQHVDDIIVTKDDDFAERTARTTDSPVVIWLRIGNATNRALMIWLTPRWQQITTLLDAGNRLIEVR